MPAVIFSGTKVKTLKGTLSLNGGADIISSTTDPTSSAVDAEPGSLLLNTSTGVVFSKQDSGSTTNWEILGPTIAVIANDNDADSLTANVTDIPFKTTEKDTRSAWDGTKFTAPETGFYSVHSLVSHSSVSLAINSYINGTLSKRVDAVSVSTTSRQLGVLEFLNDGDTLSFRSNTNITLISSSSSHWIGINKA